MEKLNSVADPCHFIWVLIRTFIWWFRILKLKKKLEKNININVFVELSYNFFLALVKENILRTGRVYIIKTFYFYLSSY